MLFLQFTNQIGAMSRAKRIKLEEGESSEYPKYGEHSLDHYFVEEINEKVDGKRFRVAVYRKGIKLKNIEDAPSTPDDLLQTVIDYLINKIRNERIVNGKKPERFSVVFRSIVLQKPIQVNGMIFQQCKSNLDWIWKF